MKSSITKGIAVLVVCAAGSITRVEAADELFRASEFSLSLFGGWVDKDDSDFTPGAGLTYYITKHIGVGAATYWENWEGTFFDNVAGEGYFRLPIGDLPIAPYAVVAFGYSFESEETFESFGLGAEWKFNAKWSVFGDVRYLINNDTDDGAALRLGARLSF